MESLFGNKIVTIIVILFVSHLVTDFLFQTDKSIARKNVPGVFILHITIVASTTYLLCGMWNAWYIPVIIGLSHAIFDSLKLFFEKKNGSKTINYFLLDQLAHILIIVLLGTFLSRLESINLFWLNIIGDSFIYALTLLGGLILVIKVSGIIIGMLVKPLLEATNYTDDKANGEAGNKNSGIIGGGEIIGQLERLLIFFFVLVGVWGAIGFLVAAKSIFRFGELKDKENRIEAEYILIGTLYSFSFGLIFSWLTHYTITRI